jgi:hypothetical protein
MMLHASGRRAGAKMFFRIFGILAARAKDRSEEQKHNITTEDFHHGDLQITRGEGGGNTYRYQRYRGGNSGMNVLGHVLGE